MKLRAACVLVGLLALSLVPLTVAQSTAETTSPRPRLVRFSGTAKDLDGNPQTGVIGVTFAFYSEQTGGAALWLETQNVTADSNGHYAALLGSTKPDGLPTDLFTTEQARWVGVQVSGQAEEPRVLLLSVPYALKAADAETLGGKPASAYLLNPQSTPALPTSTQSIPVAASKAVPNSAQSANSASISGSGTTNYLPRWTSSTNLGNSIIFQSTANKLGIGTTSPLATLDIRESTGMRAIASGNVTAVYGNATVASGTGKGVEGDTSSTSGTGVAGVANATTGSTQGMWGANFSTSGVGVLGQSYATSGSAIGVEGLSASSAGTAGLFNNTGGGKILSGQAKGTEVFSVNGNGVTQVGTQSTTPAGILNATSTSAAYAGLTATGWPTQLNDSTPTPGIIATGGLATNGGDVGAPGVVGTGGGAGNPNGSTGGGPGVAGFGGAGDNPGEGVAATGGNGDNGGAGLFANGGSGSFRGGTGVIALGQSAYGIPPDGDGLVATTADGGTIKGADAYAGNFTGDVNVTGTIFAGTKDFKIDHPLDPANKYLVHTSVESSEMKNIYDGNVTTDGEGQATVQLPGWFQALNTDFRYQLTVIGQFAQAIVGRKIENNQFEIRTSMPNVEVSWQVTGVRQDPYAKTHPLTIEQEKDTGLRGYYIHPELYGAPPEKQIEWARHPQIMKRMTERRARQLATLRKQAVPRN
jgi:trimeric autotransporter adhesin